MCFGRILVGFLLALLMGCQGRSVPASSGPDLVECRVEQGSAVEFLNTSECIEALTKNNRDLATERDELIHEYEALDLFFSEVFHEKLELEVLVDNHCIPPLPKIDWTKPIVLPREDPIKNDVGMKDCMSKVYTEKVAPLNDLAKIGMTEQQLAERELRERAKIVQGQVIMDIYCSAEFFLYLHTTPDERIKNYPNSSYSLDEVAAKRLVYATNQVDIIAAVATYPYELPQNAFCMGLSEDLCPRERSAIILNLVHEMTHYDLKPSDLHPSMTSAQIAKLWQDANDALLKKWASEPSDAVLARLCTNIEETMLTDPQRVMPPTGFPEEFYRTLNCISLKP